MGVHIGVREMSARHDPKNLIANHQLRRSGKLDPQRIPASEHWGWSAAGMLVMGLVASCAGEQDAPVTECDGLLTSAPEGRKATRTRTSRTTNEKACTAAQAGPSSRS